MTDTDPQRAADIANELVRQASIYLPKVMETEAPQSGGERRAAHRQSGPSYSKTRCWAVCWAP